MAAAAREKNDPSKRNGRSSGRSRTNTHRRNARQIAANTLSRAQHVIGEHVAEDAADLRGEMEQLVQDIENRLDRLNALTKRGASHAVDGVSDLTLGAVNGMTARMRRGARGVSNDAAKLGSTALNRVVREIEKRPLLTLAIAVGLGIAAGFARRDH